MAIVSFSFFEFCLVDANEIVNGVQNQLGCPLTREECQLLHEYLDKDGDRQVSCKEFCEKISFVNMNERSAKYIISEQKFIDAVLSVWYTHQAEEKGAIKSFLKKFDADENGVFNFEEFEIMMRSFEPEIPQKLVLRMFKQCTMDGTSEISYEALCTYVMTYRLGTYGALPYQSYLEKNRELYKDMKKHR